jgi:hypothetical protein
VDTTHYRRMSTTPQSTLLKFKSEYRHLGFHKHVRYPPTHTWQLPGPAKRLPKRKDLEIASPRFHSPRYRPVIQLTTRHGRHPYYRIYRYTAAALRFIFLQGHTGYTLHSTRPFAEQLHEKHAEAQVTFAHTKVLLANFDVDKCYTELGKHHLYAIAHHTIFSHNSRIISVHKYTRVCFTGRTMARHRFHALTLNTIWLAVKH